MKIASLREYTFFLLVLTVINPQAVSEELPFKPYQYVNHEDLTGDSVNDLNRYHADNLKNRKIIKAEIASQRTSKIVTTGLMSIGLVEGAVGVGAVASTGGVAPAVMFMLGRAVNIGGAAYSLNSANNTIRSLQSIEMSDVTSKDASLLMGSVSYLETQLNIKAIEQGLLGDTRNFTPDEVKDLLYKGYAEINVALRATEGNSDPKLLMYRQAAVRQLGVYAEKIAGIENRTVESVTSSPSEKIQSYVSEASKAPQPSLDRTLDDIDQLKELADAAEKENDVQKLKAINRVIQEKYNRSVKESLKATMAAGTLLSTASSMGIIGKDAGKLGSAISVVSSVGMSMIPMTPASYFTAASGVLQLVGIMGDQGPSPYAQISEQLTDISDKLDDISDQIVKIDEKIDRLSQQVDIRLYAIWNQIDRLTALSNAADNARTIGSCNSLSSSIPSSISKKKRNKLLSDYASLYKNCILAMQSPFNISGIPEISKFSYNNTSGDESLELKPWNDHGKDLKLLLSVTSDLFEASKKGAKSFTHPFYRSLRVPTSPYMQSPDSNHDDVYLHKVMSQLNKSGSSNAHPASSTWLDFDPIEPSFSGELLRQIDHNEIAVLPGYKQKRFLGFKRDSILESSFNFYSGLQSQAEALIAYGAASHFAIDGIGVLPIIDYYLNTSRGDSGLQEEEFKFQVGRATQLISSNPILLNNYIHYKLRNYAQEFDNLNHSFLVSLLYNLNNYYTYTGILGDKFTVKLVDGRMVGSYSCPDIKKDGVDFIVLKLDGRDTEYTGAAKKVCEFDLPSIEEAIASKYSFSPFSMEFANQLSGLITSQSVFHVLTGRKVGLM